MRYTLLASTLLASSGLLAGCFGSDADDERDEDFLADGKADGSFAEGSPEAIGVLAVANALDEDELDDDVGLHAYAAREIAKHRAGADGVLESSDDDAFDSLAELDGAPYVGPVAFGKLLAYARANGYVVASSTWTQENPTPDSIVRTDVFAISPTDAWAVGPAGLVEHWNGSAWAAVASGVDVTLYSVWAASANDVWIVGEGGAILRWNGSTLSPMASNTTARLQEVHGTGANDVWIVGDYSGGPGLRHWNGAALTTVKAAGCASDDLFSVHAVSPTNVWVGGENRSACHLDGSTWTNVSFTAYPYQDEFTAMWASPAMTLAVFSGEIYRHNGTTWVHAYRLPDAEGYLVPQISDLHATSDNDVWAVGSHGYIVHYDGTTWSDSRIPGNADYYAVAASGSGDAWSVGQAARARYRNGTWTESYDVVSRQWLWELDGTSPTTMWALGSMGDIIRRTATGWEKVESPFSLDYDHNNAVHVISANDVWIGGSDRSGHWDGQKINLVAELQDVRAMWSSSSTDVWAVGEYGMVAHYDGSTWTKQTGGTSQNLYAVAGTSAQDVWVGGQGHLRHYDGTSWTTVELGLAAQETISTITAIAPNDVWIAGESQQLRHFDGTTWTAYPGTTEQRPWFGDSFARASDDVYFVLGRRELVHWNGTTLEHEAIPGAAAVTGFGSTLWVTGEDGLVLRR